MKSYQTKKRRMNKITQSFTATNRIYSYRDSWGGYVYLNQEEDSLVQRWYEHLTNRLNRKFPKVFIEIQWLLGQQKIYYPTLASMAFEETLSILIDISKERNTALEITIHDNFSKLI